MHQDDCWDGPGPALPSVILVGRAGLTARLFIAWWAWPPVFTQHPTNQHVKICKYTNTAIYIRAWPVYTKLHIRMYQHDSWPVGSRVHHKISVNFVTIEPDTCVGGGGVLYFHAAITTSCQILKYSSWIACFPVFHIMALSHKHQFCDEPHWAPHWQIKTATPIN